MKIFIHLYIIILLTPIFVLADDNFEATIIGNNALCYHKAIDYSGDENYFKTSQKISFNAKVKIKKETYLKDTRLIEDSNNCYIKSDQFIGGIFDPNTFKITHYDKPKNIVLLSNNIMFHGGPNKDYLDSQLTLNENIILQSLYSNNYNWFLIKYVPNYICNKACDKISCYESCSANEKTQIGWININNNNYGIDGDEIIFFPNEVNIINDNSIIGTIPKGSEITKYYYTYKDNEKIIYVFYNDLKGYVYDIPLFKGNTTINLNNKIMDVNYYNFKYQDKAFIYVNDQLLELDYKDFNIINERLEIKNNDYIENIFTNYRNIEAPTLDYNLTELNKENKETLPSNYLNKQNQNEIDNTNTTIDNNNNNENEQETPSLFHKVLYIIAIILLIIIFILYLSYQNERKKI